MTESLSAHAFQARAERSRRRARAAAGMDVTDPTHHNPRSAPSERHQQGHGDAPLTTILTTPHLISYPVWHSLCPASPCLSRVCPILLSPSCRMRRATTTAARA